MSPKALETLKLIRDTQFLRRDFEEAIRHAATWTADNIEDEKKIAREITKIIFREYL
jgi:hypothetical protein